MIRWVYLTFSVPTKARKIITYRWPKNFFNKSTELGEFIKCKPLTKFVMNYYRIHVCFKAL